MDNDSELISLDAGEIKRRIFTIRGRQVMTDSALAEYFGTTTGNLNRAMKRNIKRFPESFCFQLTDDEILRCQIGIPMQKRGIKGGRTYLPYVYTEQGIAMLTSVLHTERAIAASISIRNATRKLIYRINFSAAVNVCRKFFFGFCTPDFVEAVIQKNILPIRSLKGRPRLLHSKPAVSFLYRVA